MHRLLPFLPILLALSTSSPFWAGCKTGLLGYRNAVNDAFPRSGLPEMFESLEEYESYVQALVDAKIMGDSRSIWWALRPSLRHPTLELRITDSCTAVEDAVAIAALYRALVRHVVRRRNVNTGFGAIARALIEENRWRAQRYGTNGSYVDLATRQTVSFDSLLAETLHSVQDDAAELGIEDDIKHVLSIKQHGTSAHRQLKLYDECRKSGRPPRRAMREVASWLRAATECGTFIEPESERRRGRHPGSNLASNVSTPEHTERLFARG